MIKKTILSLCLSVMFTGCSSIDLNKLRDSARASGSETHHYNMARLQAEVEHAGKPLVEFRASPEALQILATSGQPLELTVHNPYLSLSSPLAPWWHRLVPDFRDLAYVGVGVFQIQKSTSIHREQIRSSEARELRQIEAQTGLIEKLSSPIIFIDQP